MMLKRRNTDKRLLAFLIDYNLFLTIVVYSGIPFPVWSLGIYILFKDIVGGQTAGRKIVGLKISRVDQKKLMPIDCILRNITFILFPIGELVEYIFLIFNKDNQRIGDLIAKTKIVDTRIEFKEITAGIFSVFMLILSFYLSSKTGWVLGL